MKKVIEFQESKLTTADLVARWPGPRIRFEDQILKPEFSSAKAKLPEGTCTIRVLPPIKDSARWWMPIDALTYSGGQHAHPRTFDHEVNARSVFDVATAWFKKQAPQALYNKSTGKGFKLWTSPMAACWLLVTNGGQTDLKLLLASAFPGMTARQSGLAHHLKEFVLQHNHLLNPDAKCAIEMTRSLPEGSKYLQTEFKLVDSDHTLNDCIADLPSEHIRMVCPIEQTIRRIDQDDEWKLLEKTIGCQWVERIRSAP